MIIIIIIHTAHTAMLIQTNSSQYHKDNLTEKNSKTNQLNYLKNQHP